MRHTSSGGNVSGVIVAIIVLALIAFAIFMRFRKRHTKLQTRLKDFGTKAGMSGFNTSGLPAAPGALVDVINTPEHLIFVRGASVWEIPKERIIDVVSAKGSQLKGMYNGPSAGGAVAGYILAGVPGAVIGALAANSIYLTVAYKDTNGEDATILIKYKDQSTNTITPQGIEKSFDKYKESRGVRRSTL